jgi:cytidylate kinase
MKPDVIGIVGPCSSGKSTLAKALRDHGCTVKEIRQEHAAAPDMWLRLTRPDILIYLDVSPMVAAKREGLSKPSSWWQEEREVRLAHARRHCDLYIDTSSLTSHEVLVRVERFLNEERAVFGRRSSHHRKA